ncbi:MAG: hypothetical protein LBK13_13105 [Spirochaetales bacterium]|nr:hypothetical protein [Spirochaetales bacterium]
MRKTLLKAAVLAMSTLVLYGCILPLFVWAASVSPPPKWPGIVYQGEDEPLLGGTEWFYSDSNRNRRRITFLSDGTWVDNTDDTLNGTWQRVGDNLQYVTSDGYFYAEGYLSFSSTKPSEHHIWVTMYDSYHNEGDRETLYTYDGFVESEKRFAESRRGSSSGSDSSSSQSTGKKYTVTVWYEIPGGRLPYITMVQASSPTEATMLGRIEWENALGQYYKYLSASASEVFF